MKRTTLLKMLALLFIFTASMISLPGAAFSEDAIRPMVFVHGSAGSAAQFESQAMRFTSNGYPQHYIRALEYNSGSMAAWALVPSRLEALIDNILAETGADKVDILAHSLGTLLMSGFWNEDRSAKVANYVAIDGFTSAASVGYGVRTMGLWAGVAASGNPNPARAIEGAVNVIIPGQYHVQVATSAEAFAAMYEFFTGGPPATKDIVPVPPGRVEISGRAVIFPANQGVGDATLQIWEVHGSTGQRKGVEPAAVYSLSGSGYDDGAWGPFAANGLKSYEFVLLREGFRPHHFYSQPFIRSNDLVRLNTSPAGGIGEYMSQSPYHSNIVVSREKEWRDNDVLSINGISVLGALAPISKAIIGLFIYDDGADGESDLTRPVAYYHGQTFMSGIDLFMPADDPPQGTISIEVMPREGSGKAQVINIANWPSSDHAISVRISDYSQDINSWPEYVPRQAPGRQKK